MTRFDLSAHRDRLLRQVLPRYEALGPLAFAYAQGSLVSGYTDEADLDVIIVWHQPEVPADGRRAAVVARLDERQPGAPFVVDYRDVRLDRFVLAGQEYSIGHHALPDFAAVVDAVLAGREPANARVLNPLTLVSGFRYGELLADPDGHAARLLDALAPFPPALAAATRRHLRNNRATWLADLQKFAARGDGLAFHDTLVAAARAALQALFAAHEVYFPGDKWLRPAMVRFGVGERAITAFDRLWAPQASLSERIAALEQLIGASDEAEGSTARGTLRPCNVASEQARRRTV